MDDCIFCKISKGEMESAKVWEDEDTFAFLDVNPIAKGHCLISPKNHFINLFDIDEKVLQKISLVAKDLADRMKRTLGCTGVNLVNASGKDAEQSVFHFHLHVVPRYENDNLHMNEWWRTKAFIKDMDELKKLADQLNNK